MKSLFQLFAIVAMLHVFTFEAQGEITYKASDTFGGNGGQPFLLPEGMAQNYISQINYIKKISLKVSHRIEKIQVTWAQLNEQELVQATGEDGGAWVHIHLSEGEYISKVTGKTGQFVNQLTFFTSSGKQYGPFGCQEGNAFQIDVPRGYKVFGFLGNSGQCIDKIGLIYKVDLDKISQRQRPSTGSRQGRPASSTSRKPNTTTVRPGSVTPRPAPGSQGTGQTSKRDQVIDHRKPTKGKPAPQKTRSTIIDHREAQKAARRKWMKDNNLDPDRAGG